MVRIMIVKMIKNLENKMEKMQESINKDLEELKNKHTKTNNTTTDIKNTLEGINSRISEAVAYLWEAIKHTKLRKNYENAEKYYTNEGANQKHRIPNK